MTKPALLIVDDEEDILLLYKNLLKKDNDIVTEKDPMQALNRFSEKQFDLAILDIIMPGMSGIDILRAIKKIDPSVEVIMVTASKDIKPAVDSLKLGAFDYIVKPFEVDDLTASIKKALERRNMIRENLYLKQTLDERTSLGKLIGKSRRMRSVFEIIESASQSSSTILITGESGTGKEIVAETVHKKSKRKDMPYVIVNCAAIPDNLLESELFGHERGSFTGALERRIGKFEMAGGGTIFLDEIGEMAPAMQAKLLRVLQEGMIERVGGDRMIPVDLRIIAATNIDIAQAIKQKKFREDLYYRLNVIPIELPPLREKLEDLPLFISYFIDRYNKDLNKNIKGVTKEAMAVLEKYQWPGNVRELENLIERIITLSNDDEIGIKNLPKELMSNGQPVGPAVSDLPLKDAVKEFERNMIKKAMEKFRDNQTLAARSLGVHRTTFISKLESLGMKE